MYGVRSPENRGEEVRGRRRRPRLCANAEKSYDATTAPATSSRARGHQRVEVRVVLRMLGPVSPDVGAVLRGEGVLAGADAVCEVPPGGPRRPGRAWSSAWDRSDAGASDRSGAPSSVRANRRSASCSTSVDGRERPQRTRQLVTQTGAVRRLLRSAEALPPEEGRPLAVASGHRSGRLCEIRRRPRPLGEKVDEPRARRRRRSRPPSGARGRASGAAPCSCRDHPTPSPTVRASRTVRSMGRHPRRACARARRGTAPSGRSSSSSSAATTPARSTSSRASGWTTRGPSGSASSRASTTSRCRCTRRSSAGSGISRRAGASGRPRSGRSTGVPGSPPHRAPRSSSSIRASCSAAAGKTRSTRSWNSSRSSGSGSRARTGPSRSGSRSWAACATSARSTTASRSVAARAGCGRSSTSRTCTRRATARSSSPSRFARPSSSWTRCSPRTPRSTSTSRTSRTPTGTRRSTCPTATGRSAPTRSARRSTASSGRRRRREGQPDLPGSLPGVPARHHERRNRRRPLPDREASERGPRHRLRRCSHHRVRVHRGRNHLRARRRGLAA